MYRAVDVENFAPAGFPPSCPASHPLILQPAGHLDRTNYQEFKGALEAALQQPASEIVVDCMWIEAVDEFGFQTLMAAMEQAAHLGKKISLTTLNRSVHIAMEAEWRKHRAIRFGSWQDSFSSDFEHFLGHRPQA